jgi:hypothetical protein
MSQPRPKAAQERVDNLYYGYPMVADSLRLLGVVMTLPLIEQAIDTYRLSLDMEMTEGRRTNLRRRIIAVALTVKDARGTARNPYDNKKNYLARLKRLDADFLAIARLLDLTEDELHTECGRQMLAQV